MSCEICEQIKEKKLRTLYEDNNFILVLAGKCTPGHIQILPKKHVTNLEELENEETEDIFFMASFAASALFELLGAQGTNIIINETDPHLTINVIARTPDDGLNFQWQPRKADPNELAQVESNIKSNMLVGEEPEEEKPVEIEKKIENLETNEEKENYLIKALLRIP